MSRDLVIFGNSWNIWKGIDPWILRSLVIFSNGNPGKAILRFVSFLNILVIVIFSIYSCIVNIDTDRMLDTRT